MNPWDSDFIAEEIKDIDNKIAEQCESFMVKIALFLMVIMGALVIGYSI